MKMLSKSLRRLSRDKRAMSPVIGELILVSCVLVLGIVVWSFAIGYSNYEQTGYWQKVNENVYMLKERFVVENVAFNSTSNSSGILHVWIYNYGEINIQTQIYILRNGIVIAEDLSGTTITMGSIAKFTINLSNVSVGNELLIKVKSLRGNVNYEAYTI